MSDAIPAGKSCIRKLCNRERRCAYSHSCAAKTPAEIAALQERNRLHRESIEAAEAQEAADRQRISDDRRHKIDTTSQPAEQRSPAPPLAAFSDAELEAELRKRRATWEATYWAKRIWMGG